MYLFARYTGDNLYRSEKRGLPAGERMVETQKLREYIYAHYDELFE